MDFPKNLKLAIGIAILALPTLSAPALARGPGGGGHSSGSDRPAFNAAAGANSNGRFAADADRGSARAEDRMSAQGLQNTNGPNSLDRDTGLDRAEDRRSEEGAAHAKAQSDVSTAKKSRGPRASRNRD